jgi:GlpG protein
MRQIGTIPNESDARRLGGFLSFNGIDNTVERDGQEWALWVHNEDRLADAREELARFRENSDDPRYAQGAKAAEEINRREEQHRDLYQERILKIRRRLQRPMPLRCPVTFALIAASVIVTLLSGFGSDPSITRAIVFGAPRAPLYWIFQGQVWRLITPIFLHLGKMHLLFNMIMLFQLGTLIETVHGSLRAALLVLVSAVISNVAQAMLGGPIFGGMSGVLYAQFGYVWMRGHFDPSVGFSLRPDSILVMVGWAILCGVGVIPNVANYAHFGGLFVGMFIGLASAMLRRQGWV